MTKKKNSLNNFRKQARNANKHTERGLDLLNKSMRKNGWIGAMTAANDGEIFDGSARLETVTDALPNAPIIVETDGTRPIIIKRTDIKKASDPKAVRLALEANRIHEIDLNWDVDVLGDIAKQKGLIEDLFADSELKKLGVDLGEPEEAPEAQMDKADELLKKWKVKTGDLWEIGAHRILCGDCTKTEDVERLLGGEIVGATIADPPYGMDLDADYSNLTSGKSFGKGKKHEAVIGDDKPFDMATVVGCDCKEQFWFGADYYRKTIPDGGSWFVWDKRLTESADLMYGSCFELIWSKQKHKRNILRRKWAGFFTDGEKREYSHPTEKSVSLIIDLIEMCGGADSIYDPFLGSGTTLVACERLGRKGRAIEIAPKYVSVALQRLADMGLKPKLIKP